MKEPEFLVWDEKDIGMGEDAGDAVNPGYGYDNGDGKEIGGMFIEALCWFS